MDLFASENGPEIRGELIWEAWGDPHVGKALMRARTTACLISAMLLQACWDSGRQDAGRLSIIHESPSSSDAEDALVLLNQEVVVYFSEPIDPLSVTEETFRVVDREGRGVPGSRSLGLSGTSVIFTPLAPVQRDLSGGSFRPRGRYQVQIMGFPRAHAVRAMSGRRLPQTHFLDLQAVAADPSPAGYPSPFVPVGIGEEPLQLARPLEMAAASHRLEMHFTLPILPESLRPEAFRIFRILADSSAQELQPRSVRILPEAAEPGLHYGSSVELQFSAEEIFDPQDLLGLALFGEIQDEGDPRPLRDYRRRAITRPSVQAVKLRPGSRVALLDLDLSTIPALHSPDSTKLAFESASIGAQPLTRVESGSGQDGIFRPDADLVLEAGKPYLLQGKTYRVPESGDLQFMDVEIPAGVTLTLRSTQPGGMILRSCRGIKIDGRLRIEAPNSSWSLAEIHAAGRLPSLERLLEESFVSLVAAADIDIQGRVESYLDLGAGSPLTMICAGRMHLHGSLAPQVVLVPDDPSLLSGAVESPIPVPQSMGLGKHPGAEFEAEAYTDWFPLGARNSSQIQFELQGMEGDLEVHAQLAPPHPVRDGEPHVDAETWRQPAKLSTGGVLDATSGWFMRFRLRVRIRAADETLPSLRRILVYDY